MDFSFTFIGHVWTNVLCVWLVKILGCFEPYYLLCTVVR
jgi:hypothetical protein